MEQKAANTTSQQKSSSSLIFVFRAPFWIFVFWSFLHKGKTNHIPVKGEIPALPDVVFPAFPPSLQSLPSLTLLLFLLLHLFHLPLSSLLCGTEVFKTRRAIECTLDSALNRLTHFIDDADDTLLMILIKIGSWQADMFQYDNVTSVVLSFHVEVFSAPCHFSMKSCRKIHVYVNLKFNSCVGQIMLIFVLLPVTDCVYHHPCNTVWTKTGKEQNRDSTLDFLQDCVGFNSWRLMLIIRATVGFGYKSCRTNTSSIVTLAALSVVLVSHPIPFLK